MDSHAISFVFFKRHIMQDTRWVRIRKIFFSKMNEKLVDRFNANVLSFMRWKIDEHTLNNIFFSYTQMLFVKYIQFTFCWMKLLDEISHINLSSHIIYLSFIHSIYLFIYWIKVFHKQNLVLMDDFCLNTHTHKINNIQFHES